jgi:hypothetical protein
MTHAFHAEACPLRKRWRAVYTTSKGSRYVRDEQGLIRWFQTERQAEKAAMVALCRELDGPHRRVTGKTLVKRGRLLAAEVFR